MVSVVRRATSLVVASVAVVALSGVSSQHVTAAGLKPITAKVPAGYKLIAIAKNGAGSVATTKKGTSSLVPTASVVTLHLLTASGDYAGPVVVGTKKVGGAMRALLGVKAGAALGKITYVTATSYGKAKLAAKFISASTYSNASAAGVPYGAGTLGYGSLVAGKSVGAQNVRAMAEDPQVGADPDKDGIPNAIDADDNGNGVLDVVDKSTTDANSNQSGPRPFIFSDFFLDISRIIRVKDEASAALVKESVKASLKFVFGMSNDNGAVTNVAIDCLGISWCNTATVFGGVPNAPSPLWSTVDKDGDGKFFDLGTRVAGNGTNFDSSIRPNVYPSDIKPGQMFNFIASYGTTKKVIIPSAITSFFVTAPAPKTIGNNTITYPVTGRGVDNPYTTGNGTLLRIETFRPMRPLMPSESSTPGMKDMGGLSYYVTVSKVGAPTSPTMCTAESYGALTSNLTAVQHFAHAGLKDTSADSMPSEQVMVGFTVDLAKCGANIGVGDSAFIDLNVGDIASNHSVANFYVKAS